MLTGLFGPRVRPATLFRQRSQIAPAASARTYPSAAASRVLHLPSGASMPVTAVTLLHGLQTGRQRDRLHRDLSCLQVCSYTK